MPVYKVGRIYYFDFIFNGQRVKKSTKQTNQRVAEEIERAYRTKLAKGEVDLTERRIAPTLKEFSTRFLDAIKVRTDKFHTIKFYNDRLNRLLEYNPIADAKLNRIDENLIERYVQHRIKKVGPVSVNRELGCLRRVLRLAHEWGLIIRVPKIKMLPGENSREFVLSLDSERAYLEACPQPLRDAALILLDTGLRPGEAAEMQWKDVHFEPAKGAKFGYIHISKGKTKNARRNVPMTPRVKETLLVRSSERNPECGYVFAGEKGNDFFLPTSFDHQHIKVRTQLGLQKDFVLHSLRHTMLTRLGESGVDAFTIMKIAGHSSITISQRYIHPSSESVERAFEKLIEWSNAATLISTLPQNQALDRSLISDRE
jgi:integrase